MAKVNIRELKANLSHFVERAQAGETIVVARHNEPVAELRPIGPHAGAAALGKPVKGLRVPPTFFEPLPEALLKAFSVEDHE